MTETTMDQARLAAFVDGELTPEDAAAVVMHLANHPADQAFVDELMALNEMIADAYDAPLHEPAPEAILSTIAANGEAQSLPDSVVAISTWRRARTPAAWGLGGALAASLAMFLVINNSGGGDPGQVAVGPIPSAHPQSYALNELGAGQSRIQADGRKFGVTASFQTPDRGVCREFSITDPSEGILKTGVACPAAEPAEGWVIEVVDIVTPESTSTAFIPASGIQADPIGDFLDSVGAGRALAPEEEGIARSECWRLPR